MKPRINSSFASLILTFGLLIFSLNTVAQGNNDVYRIYDENSTQKGSIASKSIAGNIPSKLLDGSNPTVYIQNNSVLNQTGFSSPLVLKLEDTNSYGFLNQNHELFKEVQVITLEINNQSELIQKFDADKIKGFNKLKYIYVKCQFECSEKAIRDFVINADPEIIIYYKVVNPS